MNLSTFCKWAIAILAPKPEIQTGGLVSRPPVSNVSQHALL